MGYIRFFETNNSSFLLESIYVNCYNDFKCMALRYEGNVTILFDNLLVGECEKAGVALIADEEKFGDYYRKFNIFLNVAHRKSENFVYMGNVKDLVNLFVDFLNMYRWTESFYTDGVYRLIENEDSNYSLRKNVKLLERLKTNARMFLNDFFNGSNSYLSRISLTCTYGEQLFWMSVSDIVENRILDRKNMEERKENHLLVYKDNLIKETDNLYTSIFDWKIGIIKKDCNKLSGMCVSQGSVRGQAFVFSADFSNYDNLEELIENMPHNVILVSETTSPDLVVACHKAIGIVTNQGGLGSHAAIISRELKIPCVVGTRIATQVIKTGDTVSINGDTGEVIIHDKRTTKM